MNNKSIIYLTAAAIGGYFIYKKYIAKQKGNETEFEPEAETKPKPKPKPRPPVVNNYSPFKGKKFLSLAPKDAMILKSAYTDEYIADLHQNVIDGEIVKIPYNVNLAASVLAKLKTQSQFAWLAIAFETKYKITLESYLKSKMDITTFNMFNSTLIKKPKYYPIYIK